MGSSSAIPRVLGSLKVVMRLNNLVRLQSFANRYFSEAGLLGVADSVAGEKLFQFFIVLRHNIEAL